MNLKTMLMIGMVIGLLLMGCSQTNAPPSGYYGNNPQGAQQGAQYAGGGCGLASSDAQVLQIPNTAAEA